MNVLDSTISNLLDYVRKEKPRLVGISFMTPQVRIAKDIAQGIKSLDPAISVIVGGAHASAIPEEVLQGSAIDFVAIGEGEETMSEVARCLLIDGKSIKGIHGLAYRQDGRIVICPPRKPIEDLDSLPIPAWRLLAAERYSVRGFGGDIRKPTYAILSSRGCPNDCIFCDSHTVFGRRFRGRSAKNIFSELIFLHERFGAEQFDFVDDTITIDRDRLMELSRLILDSRIGIRWMCNARVNTVDLELLRMMKEAGCIRVDFGVESGDPEVLKAIKKRITLEQVRSAHRWAKQVGLSTLSFFMVGNPGETWQSVIKTVELAKEIQSDFPCIGIATPYPGSELYRIAQRNGWILDRDWTKYSPSAYQDKDFRPVMRTKAMTRDDILKAYYFANVRFARRKYQVEYGKTFWLNPIFYRQKVFGGKGLADTLRLAAVSWNLLRGLFISGPGAARE
jgi:radical SAM superfamily enzyme YgiQ (UPF0313 family)